DGVESGSLVFRWPAVPARSARRVPQGHLADGPGGASGDDRRARRGLRADARAVSRRLGPLLGHPAGPSLLSRLRGDPMAKQWYIVHTYSGHENKAMQALLERAKAMGKADL